MPTATAGCRPCLPKGNPDDPHPLALADLLLRRRRFLGGPDLAGVRLMPTQNRLVLVAVLTLALGMAGAYAVGTVLPMLSVTSTFALALCTGNLVFAAVLVGNLVWPRR